VKRQDVNGVERLAVDDTGGGAGSSVDLVGINGVTPSTGLGASDAGTLRVAISSDSPSTGNTAASATGAAVPANADYQGVNVGGTLRGATGVNPSGSIFAQQGDLTSVAGTTTATGNGVVSAGVQRVAIASDNTAFSVNATLQAGAAVIGHVITDTGSTTAVTGNVTVVQATGTNLHAVLDSGTTTVTQATGTNLHTVVDSGSITVTQATGTNLHTVVDSGTITTVSAVTSITNALPAGTNLIGKVSASNETSTIYSGTTAVTPKFAAISASSNGNNTVVIAGTNKIRVLGWNLMSSGTVNVKWQSGAGGTDLTGLYYLIANTGISVAYSPVGWFETASATLLNLNLSAGVAVGGNICYIDVA